MTALDPANPLVLDTRSLGRRAGAMSKVSRILPAPEGWGVATCTVVAGSQMQLQLRLEGVVEGVLVSGTATVSTQAECSRCLDQVHDVRSVDLQQLFEYPDLQQAMPEAADDPLPTLVGDLLDLEPTVRDAVVLELPLVPLCSADCPGLCEVCGARLADEPGHRHDEHDARWAMLNEWLTETDDVPAPGAGQDHPMEKGD